MKPFKIAVWLNPDDVPERGGGFSFTQRLVEYISAKKFSGQLEVIFTGFNLPEKTGKQVINLPFSESYFISKRNNFFHKYFSISLGRRDINKNYSKAIRILKENDVQMIFYPNPYIQIPNFPYIAVHFDVGHRSMYSFPEVTMNNNFEERELTTLQMLNNAIFTCCISESGKAEVVNYYRINPDKLKILPLFPGRIVDEDIVEKQPEWIKGEENFFLYPAQFWAHKNHYNLIGAFKKFADQYPEKECKLILPGSDKGNLNYIRQIITEKQLDKFVLIPGFISNEELKWLYRNSIGLVFASFLGPLSMPLLEASSLGCNIACSDLEGHRELFGQNALYFDPKKPESIAGAMIRLIEFKNQSKKQASPGSRNIADILESIFLDSIPVRATWGQNDRMR